MTKNIDMLHGPLMKKIFWFALPIAGSSIMQQLFNAADVAVAGRFAESGALAAVGSNSVLVSFYINLFAGLSVGVNVVVSHFLGQQKRKEVGTVIHTAVLFSLFCGLILMAAGLLFSRQLLTVIGTPADVPERAILYFRIYCLGVPFISLYNFCAVILRSTGDTRRPLYCLAISVVLNIILNLLLVIGFHLGVAGVAIATSLANMAGSVMILWILSREKEDIRLELKKLDIHMPALARMLRIGVPAALQSIVFSLSNICLQTAVNGFGSSAVAGMTAAVNFEHFGYYIVTAFGQAAVTFVGQNYGAGQYKRCRKALRLCMLEGVAGAAVLTAVILVGRDTLIQIYTTDPEEIRYAMVRLFYGIPFLFLAGMYEITGSSLRGMGRSLTPALLAVLGTVVFRVFWVYRVFPIWDTFSSLMMVYPVSWALTGTMMTIYYFLTIRKIDRPSSVTG